MSLLAFFILVSPATAGGEIYVRDITASDLPACKHGTAKEIFRSGGDAHGSYSSLVIACLQDDQTASWVLISGTNCYPENDETERPFCTSEEAQSIPQMAVDPDFWDAKKQRAPFRMEYQLIKSGLGTGCHAVRQPTSDQYADYSAWLCDMVTLHNGTMNPQTYENLTPKNFALKNIWTESRKPLTPPESPDWANSIPSSFIFDDQAYIYNHR